MFLSCESINHQPGRYRLIPEGPRKLDKDSASERQNPLLLQKCSFDLFCEKDEGRRRYRWESQHETTYVLVVVVGLTTFLSEVGKSTGFPIVNVFA
jgi:hypothetical protein